MEGIWAAASQRPVNLAWNHRLSLALIARQPPSWHGAKPASRAGGTAGAAEALRKLAIHIEDNAVNCCWSAKNSRSLSGLQITSEATGTSEGVERAASLLPT
jgi:hypothetical protein